MLAHERIAVRFDAVMNHYDLERRLGVLLDDFLHDLDLRGQLTLDAGSGTGQASAKLSGRGARVVSLDIGLNLMRLTVRRCATAGVVGDMLSLPFPDGQFNVVFSSEAIEHTPDPLRAATELYRVLKPHGRLVLSTPNKAWLWAVRLSNRLGLRAYDGLENFVRPAALRRHFERLGAKVLRHQGLHLLPFQLSLLHPVLRRIDRHGELLLRYMINQCILIEKP